MCWLSPPNPGNFIVEVACFAMGAVGLFTLGIMGLKRRPFLVSNGIMLFLTMSGASMIFIILDVVLDSNTWWAALLVTIFGFVVLTKISRGVILHNVNYEILVDSFKVAFLKNRLPYEEKLTKFVLPAMGVEIPVLYNSNASIAQVSFKQIRDKKIRKPLIKDLGDALRNAHYPGYRIPSVYYLILGALWAFALYILIINLVSLFSNVYLC